MRLVLLVIKLMEILDVLLVPMDFSLNQMAPLVLLALAVNGPLHQLPFVQHVVVTVPLAQPRILALAVTLDMVIMPAHALNVVPELIQQVEAVPAKIVILENGLMQDRAVVQVSLIFIFSH